MIKKPSFHYEGNDLYAERIPVRKIISEVGSPAFIYSEASFEEQLNSLKKAFEGFSTLICYSMKVNHNVNIIEYFVKNGCGIDIVSGGELYKAQVAGVDPNKVVYSGVAKTKREIFDAINSNILMFNVESMQELERINAIAESLGKKVNVAIRVNPGVDAKTHPHITTGLKKNKFGIDHTLVIDAFKAAARLQNINLVGIDCHIGSQLLDITPYKDAMEVISGYVDKLRKDGIEIKYIDVGGGVGTPYAEGQQPIDINRYAQVITDAFTNPKDLTFILEPGRFLAAQAGLLVTEVQYTKTNSHGKNFVIVDTGMNAMIRPPLYDAHHEVLPVEKEPEDGTFIADVVGPICESTDFFAKDREMQVVEQGDLIAVSDTGAYGIVLASHYNSHSIPVEVLVRDEDYKLIRMRESYQDMLAHEVLPKPVDPNLQARVDKNPYKR